MASFGATSLERLATVDDRLQWIMNHVVQIRDITIVSGRRGMAEQDALFADGKSTKSWPNSRHNQTADGAPIENNDQLCAAVDIAPWPEMYSDDLLFIEIAGMVQAYAAEIGVTVRWGGRWDEDHKLLDPDRFNDLGHFELVVVDDG